MSAPTRRFPLEWWAPITVPFATTTVDLQLITRECRLYGWSFVETSGTDIAEIDLYDGSSNNGNLLVPITLSPGQSTRDWLGKPGLRVQGGVFADLVAGSVRGSIWVVGLSDDAILELAGFGAGE